MPRGSANRKRPDAPPRGPRTLSLPAIPPDVAGRSAPYEPPPAHTSRPVRPPRPDPDRWDDSPSRPTHVSRPMRAAPPPDAWRDADDERRERAFGADSGRLPVPQPAPASHDLIALSHSLPRISAAGNSRAVGPLLPRAPRPQPPARPVKRTMIWQGILLAIAVATIIAGIRSSAPPPAAYASAFESGSSAVRSHHTTDLVPIQTQLDPTIGYDSYDQYKRYSGASCSAAATSSVLLAWGDPNGHIGHIIDDMGAYLSPWAGLQSTQGFVAIAQKHNYNVWISRDITAAQLAQIVNVQGIPVIVGIRYRPNSGLYTNYYRYFTPGHYLVVTGADANGFQIVDNSTYYVHYLTTHDFMALWEVPRAVVFTPKGYEWQPPGPNEWPW